MDGLSTEEHGALQIVMDLLSRFRQKGGEPMPNDKDKDQTPGGSEELMEVSAEAFTAMQEQLSTLKQEVDKLGAERDQYAERLEASETKLAEETTARQLQEMREHVQSYSHLALPLELPEKAPEGSLTAPEHFAWLQNADQTDGQVHWAFFNEVLKTANAALEEAAIFTELGAAAGEELSEDETLHRAAAAYSKEHQVDYFTALKAVAGEPLPASA